MSETADGRGEIGRHDLVDPYPVEQFAQYRLEHLHRRRTARIQL
jgi:hypothetical protein